MKYANFSVDIMCACIFQGAHAFALVRVFTVFCIACTVFFVSFRLCIFILFCSVRTSVRTTGTR